MIYFDLDGVLADMESGLMQNAEVKSLRVIVDDLISSKFTDYKGLVDDDIKTKFKSELESNPESEVKELKKAFSKYTSKVFSVASKPGFYRNLPLMPGSVEMVKKAGELSGELPNILSAPVGDENDLNNPSVIEKREWVDEHFGELVNEVIITIDKGKVVKSKDDILIDDRPKYVEKFESAGGTAILYKDSVQATAELVKLIESKPSVVEKVSNKRWIKTFRIFENTEPSIIDEVKKIVDENQYITDKDVTDDKLVVSDKWIVYISKGTMDHIKSHMSPSVELGDAPGSYYTKDWKLGVKNVISKNEPQVSDKPPFRTAWTGLDSGVKVGFVTIGHDDKISKGELDGYKKYTYERPVRDSKVEETILIKVEDAKETNFLTIVGAKVGEVSGKGLISLWTTYPDLKDGKVDGKDIPMNRSEFEKAGFYFKCTKEFFDKVPNEVSESKRFKYLKTFESFS